MEMVGNKSTGKCFMCKIFKAYNVCYVRSICFSNTMRFGPTATSQRLLFSLVCFAACSPGCTEGWKTLTAANWRNMLNLMQLSPGAHADDVMFFTVFQSCGGTEGAVAAEQASRPYEAKGTPGWIRIRGG